MCASVIVQCGQAFLHNLAADVWSWEVYHATICPSPVNKLAPLAQWRRK